MEQSNPDRRKALLRKLLIDLAIMGVIGVVLALIGPFGSFQDPLALRLVVWVSFAYIGYALYAPIDTLAQRAAPALDLPVWAVRLVGVMLASVPMAAAVWILPRLPDRVTVPDASSALSHYLYVAVVGGIITLLFTLGQRGSALPAAAQAQSTPATTNPDLQTPRFIQRLPAELGTDLIALEMEDHYVRAHTALGSELVLMRLSDAIGELDGIAGEQVHRSWWVARDAVEDIRREGRNLRLVLRSGIIAPVSRTRANELKSVGWL